VIKGMQLAPSTCARSRQSERQACFSFHRTGAIHRPCDFYFGENATGDKFFVGFPILRRFRGDK
jgi:hypothetical protein